MKAIGATFLLGLSLLSGPCDAEELGKLFFSPEERLELDRYGVKRPAEPSAAPTGPRSLRLDGVVHRSDGRTTVWINGRAAPPSTARRLPDSVGAAVRLPNGQRVELKVGDTVPLPSPDEAGREARR